MDREVIIGAGLIGTLLSMFLAKTGRKVDVYERSPDIRETNVSSGRSINLTLCERGFWALDRIGVGDSIRAICVPAYGRLIHDLKSDLSYQPYGNKQEAIYSVSRTELNKVLLNYADENFEIGFHFNEQCVGVDLKSPAVELRNSTTGTVARQEADRLFGSDGAYSSVRMQLQKMNRFNYSQQYWDQGYKELYVPFDTHSDWTSEKNVLHIWPRGQYMLIGFPNVDGSFTCSLHLPFEGEVSFAAIKTEADLLKLFEQSFPDVVHLVPNLVEDYFSAQPNTMVTIKCSPWTYQEKVVLIGDAAHAIYPSYGQGANTGFEDCAVLYECMQKHANWKSILNDYERLRKPNTDAIADLCVEHFIELRDLVGDQRFLLRKDIERRINRLYPEKYKDLYSMITFSLLPHAEALAIDRKQRAIIDQIMGIDIEQNLNSGAIDNLIHELMQLRT